MNNKQKPQNKKPANTKLLSKLKPTPLDNSYNINNINTQSNGSAKVLNPSTTGTANKDTKNPKPNPKINPKPNPNTYGQESKHEPKNPFLNPPDIGPVNEFSNLPEEKQEQITKQIISQTLQTIDKEKERLNEERIEHMRAIGLKGLKSHKRFILSRRYKTSFAIIAKAFAALGLTDDDIAYLLEVTPSLFASWKRRHPELTKGIKEGQAIRNTGLLQDLMTSSRKGSFAVQIFLAKNWLGMTDRVDTTQKGEITVVYKSHIPRERGKIDVDPATKKIPKFSGLNVIKKPRKREKKQ